MWHQFLPEQNVIPDFHQTKNYTQHKEHKLARKSVAKPVKPVRPVQPVKDGTPPRGRLQAPLLPQLSRPAPKGKNRSPFGKPTPSPQGPYPAGAGLMS